MSFFKKRSVIVILIILAAIIGFFIYRGATKKPVYTTAQVKQATIVQEVSATGKIKSADSVDLSFDTSGKVGRIYAKVGDKVKAGQMIVALSNGEAAAQLLQAEANLQGEKARLEEIKKGSRPEEIQIAQTKVTNAERALSDAEKNLLVVKNSADSALRKSYDAALTAAQEAVVKAKNSLMTFTDLQFKYFSAIDNNSNIIVDKKTAAVLSLLGVNNAGRLATEDLSKLSGGAFATVQLAAINPTFENIDKALDETADALQKTKDALNVMPITSSFTSTEKSDLSSAKITVGTEVTAMSSADQTVVTQKTTNAANIAAAEASVNTAKNTLASAQDDIMLKLAGSTTEQITKQEAVVKSAEASVQNYRSFYSKTVIVSPIEGTLSKQDAKLGETVSMGTVIVSVISEAKFQIETFIPEVDITKIKIGNPASVTLDAYGSSEVFEAAVVSVEPAETVIDGVSTYKTIMQFIKEDSRVRSGMTANVDITTNKRENTLVVPARAVISDEDNKKTVKILENDIVKSVDVSVGIRGSDGNVEILSGLKEGDTLVLN